MDSPPSPGAARIVGRQRELGTIEAGLDVLDQGRAACLTFEGEPGIGKTRLLGELRASGEGRGHVVLSGAAAEFERELPFSAWIDALDAYVVSQDVAASEGWDPELAGELGQLLPSLRPAGGGEGAVADERYRTHRAVSRLLTLLAEPQPVVVVLDDLHWSDAASIELIAAMLRRPPAAPVLLALGFRPGAVADRLAPALAGSDVSRLELARLSEQEAAQLLDLADVASVAAIYRHGGGNPFFLEQLGRAGAELNDVGAGFSEGGVPAAVTGAIAGELASLPSDSRALLDAAAVAGEPFEPDLAAAIGELDESQALVALDDLLARDLVRSTQVPRRFMFRHPLVRRVVYESTRGGWRLAAHARAARTLSVRGAEATERAHHVEQSAAPGDEAAIELLLEAGRAAAARAPDAAARWYAAALRVLPSGDVDRQVSMRVALASALRSAGELERCRAILLEALELVPPDAVERRVEITTLCAAVEHWQGQHAEAHRRLARAWMEVPDQTSAAAAALQIELSIDGLYELDFTQTLESGHGALEAARAVGDRSLIASAASALCLGEAAAGQIDAAREHRAEALGHVDELTDAELAPRLEALYYLGWAENYLEYYDAAVAHVERGIAIARATGEGRLLVPMMLVKGYPFEMQGRMAEAIELCETAVEATRLAANPHYRFWALFELGWAHYYAGNLDEAIVAGEESARVGGRLAGGTMPSAGGGPGWQLACARFEAGDVERARKEMRELGSDELEHKIPVERCFDWETLALVELAVGELDAAEAYVVRGERNAEQLGLRLPAAVAGRARAELLLARGEPLEAARMADESAASATAIGARLQAAFSRGLVGRALAAAGDRKGAVAALREAEAEMDACRSVRARDRLRRELRKLGARAEVRGPASAGDSGLAALTQREREIAELITDRLTNPEIAAKLFLSKKTIESHIRNVFVKLGVSSRVEVARSVERERAGGGGGLTEEE